jgi:hypothetical protein
MKRMIASVLADSPVSYLGTTNHSQNKTNIAVGKTRARAGYTGLCRVGMPTREYFTDRRSVAQLLYKPSPQTANACALRIPSIGHQSVTHRDLSLELEDGPTEPSKKERPIQKEGTP